MYAYYNGVKQTLSADDVNGIQSVYGAYPSNPAGNRSFGSATNLNGMINSQLQVTLSANQWLDGASDSFVYLMGVPAGGTGSMTVSVQSAALSSVSPKLVIYNSNQQSVAAVNLPNTYGAVAQYTLNNVTPGSYYYIRVSAASGAGSVGTYGLLVNFGPNTQYWVQPPNTVVAAQPDKGGGASADTASASVAGLVSTVLGALGHPSGLISVVTQTVDDVLGLIHIGTLSAYGEAMTPEDLDGAASPQPATTPWPGDAPWETAGVQPEASTVWMCPSPVPAGPAALPFTPAAARAAAFFGLTASPPRGRFSRLTVAEPGMGRGSRFGWYASEGPAARLFA
jgi:hypothetical protein